jgi:multicomponent Na+:H+ antiporter subunit F
MMHSFFIVAGVCLGLLMGVLFYRVVSGPTPIDRLMAVNAIGTKTTILLLIIGTLYGELAMFVDISMTYALLNFIGSLAAARFYQRARSLDARTIVFTRPEEEES